MQKIADEYARHDLTVRRGDRLHRIVALLFDAHYDDITDVRIAEIERFIEAWRWCGADGKRV